VFGFAFWEVNVLHAYGSGRALSHLFGINDQIFVFFLLIGVFVVDVCVYGCEGAVGFATMALEGAVLFLLAVGF
jgi:hypothetical protein